MLALRSKKRSLRILNSRVLTLLYLFGPALPDAAAQLSSHTCMVHTHISRNGHVDMYAHARVHIICDCVHT